MSEEDELVTLRSSDEEQFEVSQEVAFKSETIKNMIEGAFHPHHAFFVTVIPLRRTAFVSLFLSPSTG